MSMLPPLRPYPEIWAQPLAGGANPAKVTAPTPLDKSSMEAGERGGQGMPQYSGGKKRGGNLWPKAGYQELPSIDKLPPLSPSTRLDYLQGRGYREFRDQKGQVVVSIDFPLR